MAERKRGVFRRSEEPSNNSNKKGAGPGTEQKSALHYATFNYMYPTNAPTRPKKNNPINKRSKKLCYTPNPYVRTSYVNKKKTRSTML